MNLGPGPPAAEDLRHDHPPERAWRVASAVFTAFAVAAALGAVLGRVSALWVLVGLLVLLAGVLVVHEARVPRTVQASADGVAVRARWWRRQVRWEQLRRVHPVHARTPRFARDTGLERDDGRRVRLPAEVPHGAVERWREEVGGGRRPADVLPQTWRPTAPGQGWLLLTGITLLGQLALRVAEGDVAWAVTLATLVVLMAGTTMLMLRRPAQVRADHRGLTVTSIRRRHVPWADVTEVRARDTYDGTAVVVLANGKTRTLLDVPLEVARHWQDLAEHSR